MEYLIRRMDEMPKMDEVTVPLWWKRNVPAHKFVQEKDVRRIACCIAIVNISLCEEWLPGQIDIGSHFYLSQLVYLASLCWLRTPGLSLD